MRRLTLDYLKTESGSGLVLAAAAVAAIGVAGWVRVLMMPVFFFLLAMELKFELLRGELSNPRRLALPAVAVAGGLVLPAAIYLALNRHDPSGWAIGCATDGAAALTAFSLAGPRLSHSLRVLL